MPDIKMPEIKVPFVGGAPAVEDPVVPFAVNRPLAPGHTLKLAVYRNLLSRAREFDGSVVVDSRGLVRFKDAGEVRVGGRSPLEASRAIESAFRRLSSDSTITVQLISIEEVPLVTVTGAVRSPAVIQWFDHLTAESALPYVRGRTGGADAHAVHVTRSGARRFHATATAVALEPGDVVNFSRDL